MMPMGGGYSLSSTEQLSTGDATSGGGIGTQNFNFGGNPNLKSMLGGGNGIYLIGIAAVVVAGIYFMTRRK